MTATKNARAFQASASNAAGATATGTAVDLRTALGCTICGIITNGATGPTVACSMRVEISNDGTNFTIFSNEISAVGNNVITNMQPVILPPETMYARTIFTGNTGQTVTVIAYGHELTSVA